MKCSKCGAESPDNRFFCGSCGAEMRATSVGEEIQAPVNLKSKDIVENGLVLILVGAATMVVGLLAYVTDLVHSSSGEEVAIGPLFPLSIAIPIIGMILLSVGIVVNLGQHIKRIVVTAMAFQAISSVLSIFVGIVLMMTITETGIIEGIQFKDYGYRSGGALYFFTMGLVPVVMAFVLTIRHRYAWAATLSVSVAMIPLSYFWLSNYFEPQAAASLSCVQIPVIIVLLFPSATKYYIAAESRTANR